MKKNVARLFYLGILLFLFNTIYVEAKASDSAELYNYTFDILGDSYSSFEGWIPKENYAWYTNYTDKARNNNVTSYNQMWWSILSQNTGMVLRKNESCSGATICTTGYDGKNSAKTSFLLRMRNLGENDTDEEKANILFIFGGLNDSWANSPLGEVKFENWETEDFSYVLPATSYMLMYLKAYNPNSRIIFLKASNLNKNVSQGISVICDYYGIEEIQLNQIESESGHPNQKGMQAIAKQVQEYLIGEE